MSASSWETVQEGVSLFRDSCNVYAVRGPQGTLLINAGSGRAAEHLGEVAGGTVLPIASSDPLRAEAIAIQHARGTRTLLANVSPDVQIVEFPVESDDVSVRVVDEGNAVEAMCEPEAFRAAAATAHHCPSGRCTLKLRPYAIARIDQP